MSTISIKTKEPIEDLIQKAKKKITSVDGATFEGDKEKGDFIIPTSVGKIKGNYTVNDDTIKFNITDKPMLIGYDKIENELNKYLSK